MNNQEVKVINNASSQLWEALSPYATKMTLKKKAGTYP